MGCFAGDGVDRYPGVYAFGVVVDVCGEGFGFAAEGFVEVDVVGGRGRPSLLRLFCFRFR